jgi:hypothetical protein
MDASTWAARSWQSTSSCSPTTSTSSCSEAILQLSSRQPSADRVEHAHLTVRGLVGMSSRGCMLCCAVGRY